MMPLQYLGQNSETDATLESILVLAFSRVEPNS